VAIPEVDGRVSSPPAWAGIGLRARHVAEVMATHPAVPWFEVHAENYFGGGPALRTLEAIRRDYPVALHAVGLSLGSSDGLDARYLDRLRRLVERVEPVWASEHLAWSVAGGVYLNHLLPLPYREETLAVLCRHVKRAQDALGRRLLVENPSGYLRFRHSPISEPEFLGELARRTGCGLLCDVNNIYVTCENLGLDPNVYVDALPPDSVGEIHLAGHSINEAEGCPVLIDDHGSRVAEPVWALFGRALARFGPVPTLVEWDTNVPALEVLLGEARAADRWLAQARASEIDAHAA